MMPVTHKLSSANKLETSYAGLLELRRRAGEILAWEFERLTLVLADGTRYTPDFLVVFSDHFEIHETKGFWRDDARVKIKVAATIFPWFRFVGVERKKGAWHYEQFEPHASAVMT